MLRCVSLINIDLGQVMNTQILKHGHRARLFPVLPDSQKEQKTLSIVLATLISVHPFAERLFATLGQKFGKRATVDGYTEVTLTNEVKNLKDRPDGLIVIKNGKKTWTALVEAKVGKAVIELDQLERYIQLAKLNGIDAVITITNQLTPSPEIHPIWKRALPKGLELFHVSWASIFTQAFLLAAEKEDPFQNDDEAFLTSELIRYLEHSTSGVLPHDQMNKAWPDIVKAVQSGHPPNPKSPDVREMITHWHQEARDVALIMTRRLREPVNISVSRTFLANPATWVESEIKDFCSKSVISFQLDVPNAAGKIKIEADFLRRAIRVSMKLNAPADKARNPSRLNWLLKQLKSSDLSKVSIFCTTKGRGAGFGSMAKEVNLETDEFKALGEITSFNVEMASDLSAKFNSRKKFVEELELLVPQFYENVGQHIKAWTPSPPRVRKEASSEEKSIEVEAQPSNGETPDNQESASEPSSGATRSLADRPEWARQWSSSNDNP